MRFSTISKQSFLKNDVGQDNLELINRKIFSVEINEDENVNIMEFSAFLEDLYSDCMAEGKINGNYKFHKLVKKFSLTHRLR